MIFTYIWQLTVEVARSSESGQLTVPLKVANANGYDADGNALFSVPESVTFADGEKTAEVTVTCSDNMEMFKTYNLAISVAEEYTVSAGSFGSYYEWFKVSE